MKFSRNNAVHIFNNITGKEGFHSKEDGMQPNQIRKVLKPFSILKNNL